MKEYMDELLVMSQLEHPNITQLRMRWHPCQVNGLGIVETREDHAPDASMARSGGRSRLATCATHRKRTS